MRQISALSVLASVVLMTGCSDAVAQKYAEQLAATLKKYQASVDDQIRVQVTSYDTLAKILSAGAEQDSLGQLETERLEDVTQLKDGLLSANERKRLELNESRLRDRLMAYARHDFDNSRASMTAELDGYKRFLAGLQDLDQDAANITALVKLLTDLSEKRSPAARLKEAGAFAEVVKDNVTKLECAGLTSQETDVSVVVTSLTAKLAGAKDEDKPTISAAIKSANEQLAGIAAQKTSKKCN
jgi:hypothetical protein